METLTLNLNYDPSKLPEGFDPKTSEGKRKLKELLLSCTGPAQNYGHTSPEEDQILEAFKAE